MVKTIEMRTSSGLFFTQAPRFFPCVLSAIVACSSSGKGAPDPSNDAGGADASDPCASIRESCRAKQQACDATGAAPKCVACQGGQYASAAGACATIEGTALGHTFSDFTVKPGEEILALCQSWTLGNATELWVNAVEFSQNDASHHSNWTFVPSDQYDGPDGVWKCSDRSYDQLSGALAGGVLYAQSTQAAREVQKFPAGTAIRIPPWSRIIGDVHLLNALQSAVTGHVALKLYSVPLDQVKVKLVPFHMTYRGLDIPARSSARFTGECSLADAFTAVGSRFGSKLYYVLPHYHALGTRFFVDVMGGPLDGKSLFEVKGFDSEARGHAFDPPIDLTGATGLRFGCEFGNERDTHVPWGYGPNEMCEFLGFAEESVAFESTVGTATAAGTDGATKLFTGACSTVAFPWDFKKPGGPAPK